MANYLITFWYDRNYACVV